MVQAVPRDLPAGELTRSLGLRVGFDLGPRRLLAGSAILVGLLVLAPLVFLLRTSLTLDQPLQASSPTLDHYRFVLASSRVPLVATTVAFASCSAVIALLLGGITAWLYARTDAALRGAAFVAAFVSLSMPLTVKVIGWILLLGPQAGLVNVVLMRAFGLDQPPLNLFSFGGMAALQGILWGSVVFLLTSRWPAWIRASKKRPSSRARAG
jgi:ABC-type spermidine/putrescine transport system permease subunit I